MGVFFASWQLWEEMTFVLACAIIVVFFIGLFKLWKTSRQLRRQEQIDEEKRARRMDLRRVVRGSKRGGGGDNAPRRKHRHGSNIPFGVRAIQSGVQVDGIWVLRPTTPRRPDTSEAALPEAHEGGRPWLVAEQTQQQQQQSEIVSYVPVAMEPNDDHGGLALDTSSPTMSMPLPKISEDGALPVANTSTPRGGGNGSSSTIGGRCAGTNPLNEDALRQLEGAYWPTTATTSQNTVPRFGDPCIPSPQSSGPCPGPSQSPALRSHRDTNDTLCPSPGLAQAPVLVVDRISSSSHSSNHSAGKHSRSKSQDSSGNNSSRDAGLQQQRPRVVNSSFEVLPAGTFGQAAVPSAPGTRGPRRRDSFFAPPRNKLRRASVSAPHANPEQK